MATGVSSRVFAKKSEYAGTRSRSNNLLVFAGKFAGKLDSQAKSATIAPY